MKILPCQRVIPLLALVLAACDPAPGEVREWSAADHDQPASASSAQQPRARGSARPAGGELDLAEVAWTQNCAMCHGPRGRGDGPQGPMMRAPDLTRAEWQDKASDADMLETIRKGRNRMPAFSHLPEPVLKGLVQRIRANRQR